MNLAYEFSKIKHAFTKVKEDLEYVSTKISQQYDEFLSSHSELNSKIHTLSHDLQEQLGILKEDLKNARKHSNHDTLREIKELRREVHDIEKNYATLTHTIKERRNDKEASEFHTIKEKVEASELELYLLKERMNEKDSQIKELKEVNKQLFSVVEELANVEKELLKS